MNNYDEAAAAETGQEEGPPQQRERHDTQLEQTQHTEGTPREVQMPASSPHDEGNAVLNEEGQKETDVRHYGDDMTVPMSYS